MKRLILFLLLCPFAAAAQQKTFCPAEIVAAESPCKVNPGKLPQFPGGDSLMQEYIASHLVLSKKQEKKDSGRRFYIRFNVSKTGLVHDVFVQRIGEAFNPADSIIASVFCTMPQWEPGGIITDTAFTPLDFVLEADFTFPYSSDGVNIPAKIQLKAVPHVYRYTPENKDAPVFFVAEKMPVFPGGDTGIVNYFARNLRYPKAVRDKGIEGTVFISFVVEKDGSVSNISVLKAVQKESLLSDEAVRLVLAMPQWKAGELNGKPVRVQITIPIKFKLQ